MNDQKIIEVINKLVGIIKYHKIKNASELKKYIYTHNFSEKNMKQMKELFAEYGEMNVFNCVLSYYSTKLQNTKKNLIKKIKGFKL
ncbi:hypothetical protein LCGC14_0956620 [marine sediment metagenome]|uniref:Uncharacterized protein n=1 Tax=marine sediment metagenome TaxID=412755 RepID=A0A0F9P1W6_9ZZZZ